MAEEGKKISFGFAKSIKKPVLKNLVPQEEKKVDYIECLDQKSIKVIGGEEKKDEPLIIPLLGSKTWHDRIVNKVDADIFEPKVVKVEADTANDNGQQNDKSDITNGNATPAEKVQDVAHSVVVKTEPLSPNHKTLTLEEQAAKEIVEDLKSTDTETNVKQELTLPLTEEETLRGQEESTLEDYEKIPIDAFGLAMLRGMGWQPGKGIGKNEKIVPAVVPELRPKGMGLGADKVTLQKQLKDIKKAQEDLKIEKGAFVKFIAGKQSDTYGQIEGLDEDAGRLIIKMALGGQTVSVNEFMVQPVSKSEYMKNSKVLNAKKFEEFKDKESSKQKVEVLSSDSSDDDEVDRRNHKIDKKKKSSRSRTNEKDSKSRKRRSSDAESNSDSDYGKRAKHRSRSSSTDSYKSKKVKKSKKHKRYSSSPERSSKKYKKKEKEKERTKDKKSKESEYGDRRKRKKHRRSRSRS